jgi:AraC family transcriptional regulator
MERSFGMSSRLDFTVEVKDLQELTVACVRHIGPYNGIGKAFEELGRWAGPRGLFALPGAKTLAVYHDSPGVSEPEKLRSSACLVVPEGTEVTDGVSLMKILGGKYAVARFEIAMDQFGAAWDTLMSEWFPSSGWQPEDRMCYEVYLNDPGKHPEGKFVIDICEPVRPA